MVRTFSFKWVTSRKRLTIAEISEGGRIVDVYGHNIQEKSHFIKAVEIFPL